MVDWPIIVWANNRKNWKRHRYGTTYSYSTLKTSSTLVTCTAALNYNNCWSSVDFSTLFEWGSRRIALNGGYCQFWEPILLGDFLLGFFIFYCEDDLGLLSFSGISVIISWCPFESEVNITIITCSAPTDYGSSIVLYSPFGTHIYSSLRLR